MNLSLEGKWCSETLHNLPDYKSKFSTTTGLKPIPGQLVLNIYKRPTDDFNCSISVPVENMGNKGYYRLIVGKMTLENNKMIIYHGGKYPLVLPMKIQSEKQLKLAIFERNLVFSKV